MGWISSPGEPAFMNQPRMNRRRRGAAVHSVFSSGGGGTVNIRLYSTLAHFVAPVPAMHSHGAPRRDVLVSLPIVPVLIEEGLLIAGFKGPFSWSIA